MRLTSKKLICQPERVPGIISVRPDTSDAAGGRTPPRTGSYNYYKTEPLFLQPDNHDP